MIEIDLYFNEDGDLEVAPNGDLAMTQHEWRDDIQQAYIRMMTEVSDYVLYPELGADLSRLYGMPQSAQTGDYGVSLIEAAFERENRFTGKRIEITPVPTGHQTIRFDVMITSGSFGKIKLTVEQDLGVS